MRLLDHGGRQDRRSSDLNQDKRELSKYDLFRLCRGEFAKADDAKPSIDLLVEYGYLAERTCSTSTGGRPRGSRYLLNPLFFDK